MSIESFIRAMPKADLHVQLEGAIQKDLILMIADQADIASTYKKKKQFDEWVALLQSPNYAKIDEIARETFSWVRHPEDIARVVYNLGVQYSKQNVTYVEISVIPVMHTDLGWTFQQFLDAINDGADRVNRAWKVRMNWILSIPRERPRKSDDIARWATSVTAQKGNVVGLGLVGREDVQPIAQFKKAFNTAEKKELARVTHAYSYPDSDSFSGIMETTNPDRITDAWGLIDDEDAIAYVVEHNIPVALTPSREICLGRIQNISEFPIRELLDKGVNLIVGSGLPELFETSITDEYIAIAEHEACTIDDVITIATNTFRACLASAEEKDVLLENFHSELESLREEHLSEEIS